MIKRIILIMCVVLLCNAQSSAQAQVPTGAWTLQDCLNYALENNIELRQSKNEYLSGVEDAKQAKAERLPSLAASATQGFTNYPSRNVEENNIYTGTYGVNAGLTLYGGGAIRMGIKQAEIQNRINELNIEQASNDIRFAIIEAYMQVLYAEEAVRIAKNTAEVSKAERDRAEQLLRAGSIGSVEFAQIESRWASDEYQVVAAQTSLESYKLQLKQILELDITDEISIAPIENHEDRILGILPQKSDIYSRALDSMPEVEKAISEISSAELGVKQAKAGYMPTLSLSASIGTGHTSGAVSGSGSQVWNRFNENIGLSLSVPIFSNRSNKTAVNKAKIEADNSRLAKISVEKELLREVEGVWLDAVSAQFRYKSALENEKYAQQSYDLISEQFRLGAKNVVELTTAKNDLFSASLEVLQAKYMALMNICLLDIYQGNEIK